MAALKRAVALAEMDGIARAVAEHLEFDVARIDEIFLHIDGRIAERRIGFARRLTHQAFEVLFAFNHFHAAAAAARSRLDQHRIADFRRQLARLGGIGQRSVGAWHKRQSELGGGALGLDLVAHGADMFGLGADPDQSVALDDLGELRVFGQKTVAGVDGVGVDHFGRGNDVGDVEVAVARRRRADAHRFIGQPDVHRFGVGGRVDGHGLDAHFVASAVNPERDFAAIGDEQFLDRHRRENPGQPIIASGWSNSTG